MFDVGTTFSSLKNYTIHIDIPKLQTLVEFDNTVRRNDRISSIKNILEKGFVDMNLRTSFPAKDLFLRDNFLSLLYYFGMLTIGGCYNGIYHMLIPNECVLKQYKLLINSLTREIY